MKHFGILLLFVSGICLLVMVGLHPAPNRELDVLAGIEFYFDGFCVVVGLMNLLTGAVLFWVERKEDSN